MDTPTKTQVSPTDTWDKKEEHEIMKDWGPIHLVSIYDGRDFWCLISDLCGENPDLIVNKEQFIEAYRKDTLYGFEVEETESMYSRKAYNDPIFCKGTCKEDGYLLPCLSIKERNTIQLFWVDKRVKRLGIQRELLRLLLNHEDIEFPPLPPPNPKKKGLWKKMKKWLSKW